MSDVFCNECGNNIFPHDEKIITLRWGEFCSFTCRDRFMYELAAAGIIIGLGPGEEPDVVY